MSAAFRALHPEPRDQGDPYVLPAPPGGEGRFRYYAFVTGEVAPQRRAFPVYGSDDLYRWEWLGGALVADISRAHWAPCVQHRPRLPRPYVMLYSRAIGQGAQAHIGHEIRRADSRTPEGPYVDSGHVLTAGVDFAIDPDVYRRRDGALCIAYACDFVHDAPLGTGIVEAAIDEALTEVQSAPHLLARARHPWQIFDAQRRLPWKQIPNIDWQRDTVCWYTVEAPCGGLLSPDGRDFYLYSGGYYAGFYAIGGVIDSGDAGLSEMPADGGQVLGPNDGERFFAPGHCSILRSHEGERFVMFHARYGSPQAPRQMTLGQLTWPTPLKPAIVPVGWTDRH